MAPPNSRSFSVNVVLPASGWEMIAKVRRRSTSVAMGDRAGVPSGARMGMFMAGWMWHFKASRSRLERRSGKTMASDNKTAKADQAPKSEVAAKDKSASGEATAKTEAKIEAKIEAKTEAKTETKTESGEAVAAAPSGYSRGEGQKPVSAAYKENWNAIFAKKNVKRKKR